ncbi:MAG: hypothetical protein HOQ05_09310 [Corynebacteriales bacterium]|nr:hypothetical protein [Mycobacteriales bacterium]
MKAVLRRAARIGFLTGSAIGSVVTGVQFGLQAPAITHEYNKAGAVYTTATEAAGPLAHLKSVPAQQDFAYAWAFKDPNIDATRDQLTHPHELEPADFHAPRSLAESIALNELLSDKALLSTRAKKYVENLQQAARATDKADHARNDAAINALGLGGAFGPTTGVAIAGLFWIAGSVSSKQRGNAARNPVENPIAGASGPWPGPIPGSFPGQDGVVELPVHPTDQRKPPKPGM